MMKQLSMLLSMLSISLSVSAQQEIQLDIGKGELITLSRPANTIMIADPDIANFQLPAPNKLFLFGKEAGITDLYAIDNHGNTVFEAEIAVAQNESNLQTMLDQAFGENKVAVRTTPNNVILSGNVYSPREAANIAGFVEGNIEDPESLVNQLTVTMPTQVNISFAFC